MAESLQIYEAEMNVLCDMGQIVGQLLDLDHALKETLKALSRSLAVEWALIALLDPVTGKLSMRATYGSQSAESRKGLCRLGECVMDFLLSATEPFIYPSSGKKPVSLDKFLASGHKKGKAAFLGAPLLVQKKFAGIIVVDRLFSSGVSIEEDVRFLGILARLVSEFIKLNRQARERQENSAGRNRSLLREIADKYNNFTIVGGTETMVQLRSMAETVAPSTTPVMLMGEPGTERLLVARVIHEWSPRTNGPFISLNCATLEGGKADSELISGLKTAEGGTLFLDEIGSLPLVLQGMLLSLLPDRESKAEAAKKIRRTKSDVRIIVASEKDLAPAVSEGAFREDLYYRLNVFPLSIPPLRERREDIPLLAEMFLQKIAREQGRKLRLTPVGLMVLKDYSWPGNSFELENFIQRLAIVVEGPTIDPDSLAALLASYNLVRP